MDFEEGQLHIGQLSLETILLFKNFYFKRVI